MKEDRLITIGQIIKPHGYMGEVKVKILTDNPEYFMELEQVTLTDGTGKSNPLPSSIMSCRFHKKGALMVFDAIRSQDDAEKCRNWLVQIPFSLLKKPTKDEYYVSDLEGMQVQNTDGQTLGTLTTVMWGGPQDVYEIKDENGNTCLVPACKEFIKNVDVKNKRMTINLIDGLHPL